MLLIDELHALARRVIMLVMAGKPVDATIDSLLSYLEPGDCIIDGGNEWCVCVRAADTGRVSTGLTGELSIYRRTGCCTVIHNARTSAWGSQPCFAWNKLDRRWR